MLCQAQFLWTYFRCRYIDAVLPDESGSVVETVIITAVFAALAIAVGVIIVAKVTSKAGSLDLNSPP
jgi:hypothetical protein